MNTGNPPRHDVYYLIYIQPDGTLDVGAVQWFDVLDMSRHYPRLFPDNYWFATEEEAEAIVLAINSWLKRVR